MSLCPMRIVIVSSLPPCVKNFDPDEQAELIETNIVKQSPSRIEELIAIFVRATEMEVQFWDFDAHSAER